MTAAVVAVPRPHPAEMSRALSALFDPSDVVELRAIHKGGFKRIDSGYFDHAHWPDLVAHAERLSRQGAACYVALNPVDPQLLGRYNNRVEEKVKTTTSDADILRRRWLLVDLDPTRPADTGSTDPQFTAAHERAQAVFRGLKERGWPGAIVARSGNGMHLLYAIDLPNDEESKGLVKAVLAALGELFDGDGVKVDRSVFNAARICKLYGTMSNKGDHTAAAPWRLSEIEYAPPQREIVTLQQLQELTALAPRSDAGRQRQAATSVAPLRPVGGFDLEEFFHRHGLEYSAQAKDGREMFKLAACPFNDDHVNGEAAVFLSADGALGFKCFHDSCSGKGWRDVRELLDGPRHAAGPLPPQMNVAAAMDSAASRKAAGGPLARPAAGRGTNGASHADDGVSDAHEGGNAGAGRDGTPFEPHLLTPPGMAGMITQWILDTSPKPQPALAVSAALVLMGTAMANRVRCGTSHTNLYMVNVANSGEGKDRPQACIGEALTVSGQKLAAKVPGEHLASGQALMSVGHREPTSVLVLDEIGDMLASSISKSAASFEREVLTILKTLWSHTGRLMRGKEFADQKARPRQDIQYPCIGMLGSSTPGSFYAAITPKEIEDGLLNRMLIVRAPNYDGAPLERDPIPVPLGITQWLAAACEIKPAPLAAVDQPHQPRPARPSPPAQSILSEFAELCERERRSLLTDPARAAMAGWWVRASENARRIALILAVGRYVDPEILHAQANDDALDIDPTSAQWAVDYVQTITRDMLEQSESRIGSSELERAVIGVEAALKRAGVNGLTQREARRSCNAFERIFDPVLIGRVWDSMKLRGAVAVTYAASSGRGPGRQVLISREFAESIEEVRHAA